MKLSSKAKEIYSQINENTKLGNLRKIGKTIKKDHELAMELWSTHHFMAQQLAILIMDKKLITQAFMDNIEKEIKNTIWTKGIS